MKRLSTAVLIALAGCASEPMPHPLGSGDAVDRIVAAVGVDSIHTEQELASARALVHQIVDAGDSPAIIAMREPAEFEKMVR